MEVASSLIEVATRVTVVTMDSVPFQLQLGERVGMYLRQWHEARGVRFQCKTTLRKVNIEPVNGEVYEVVLNNARIIPACLVIVGVGIVPNTQFLPSLPKLEYRQQPHLELSPDGFIKVSPFMETSLANVYAAGDVVEFPLRLAPRRQTESACISHWQMALKMGNVAAKNMFVPAEDSAGKGSVSDERGEETVNKNANEGDDSQAEEKEERPTDLPLEGEDEEEEYGDDDPSKTRFVSVPVFWSVQFGQSLRFAGYNKEFDDVVVHGNPLVDAQNPDPDFVAFYLKDDLVLAMASLNRDPIVAQFAEALRNRVRVTRESIQDDPEGFIGLIR